MNCRGDSPMLLSRPQTGSVVSNPTPLGFPQKLSIHFSKSVLLRIGVARSKDLILTHLSSYASRCRRTTDFSFASRYLDLRPS